MDEGPEGALGRKECMSGQMPLSEGSAEQRPEDKEKSSCAGQARQLICCTAWIRHKRPAPTLAVGAGDCGGAAGWRLAGRCEGSAAAAAAVATAAAEAAAAWVILTLLTSTLNS